MDKKKGIIVILIAAVAIWYFMGGEPETTPAGDGDTTPTTDVPANTDGGDTDGGDTNGGDTDGGDTDGGDTDGGDTDGGDTK